MLQSLQSIIHNICDVVLCADVFRIGYLLAHIVSNPAASGVKVLGSLVGYQVPCQVHSSLVVHMGRDRCNNLH